MRFLLSLIQKKREASHIFLLGDIFDLWVGDQDYYYKKFKPIVDALIALQKQGVKVVYFEGNHDLYMTEFWTRHGIQCFVEDEYFEVGPWRIRLGHGDQINSEDLAYKRYRSIIRAPYLRHIVNKMPVEGFSKLGDWMSRTSRKHSSKKRRDSEEFLRKLIRSYAVGSYSEKPFDFVITGHMHVKDDWTTHISGKEIHSVNLGSWFEEALVYWIDDGSFGWERLG